MSETRDENGRFTKGNTIGESTRFKYRHKISSKYKDEYCDLMYEYFSMPERRDGAPYPTFEGFAASIGVILETLENWREAHAHFRDIYTLCAQMQKDNVINGGLRETYNAQFAKFIAINNHGMKDKTEQEFKGDTDVKITVSFFEGEDS